MVDKTPQMMYYISDGKITIKAHRNYVLAMMRKNKQFKIVKVTKRGD